MNSPLAHVKMVMRLLQQEEWQLGKKSKHKIAGYKKGDNVAKNGSARLVLHPSIYCGTTYRVSQLHQCMHFPFLYPSMAGASMDEETHNVITSQCRLILLNLMEKERENKSWAAIFTVLFSMPHFS